MCEHLGTREVQRVGARAYLAVERISCGKTKRARCKRSDRGCVKRPPRPLGTGALQVMTTGATASECARVLTEAGGAAAVDVCALARQPWHGLRSVYLTIRDDGV